MPKKKQTTTTDQNGVFFFKLVLYLIIGSLWIKSAFGSSVELDLPVGLIVGLAFATHEHFQIDKKIEFAVLLIAMLVGYFAPYGLYIFF